MNHLPARPQIDGRAFRTALGAFATGVTIVTARTPEGADVGLTANSFNSVSLDPPMVLWSLAKSSSMLPAFMAADHFAVHILAHDQEAMSKRFATKGIDRFADLALDRGEGGVPLLPDCGARLECRTAFRYEGGDHIIFVGEVTSFAHFDRLPLLFHGGRYAMALQHDAEASPAPADDDLADLIAQAYVRLSSPAIQAVPDDEIRALKLILSRVLSRLDG